MKQFDPATHAETRAPLESKQRERRPSIMQIAVDGTVQFFTSLSEMIEENKAVRDQKQSWRHD